MPSSPLPCARDLTPKQSPLAPTFNLSRHFPSKFPPSPSDAGLLLRALDAGTREEDTWTAIAWRGYWFTPARKRSAFLYCPGFPVQETLLSQCFSAPACVRELGWGRLLPAAAPECDVEMWAEGSFADFHILPTSKWLSVLSGKVQLLLIEPNPSALAT